MSGSVPAGKYAHVPTLAVSHALQRPAQELLQQTPSTHTPDWHSAATVHAVPFASAGEQPPVPLQVRTPAHSELGSVFALTGPQIPSSPPVIAFEHALQVCPQ